MMRRGLLALQYMGYSGVVKSGNAMAAMHRSEWNELAVFAKALAKVAGDRILPLFRRPGLIHNKQHGGFDPVTEADRSAERTMRELIEKTYPAHGILGEELPE